MQGFIMKNEKKKLGIYFCDASFDKRNGTSVISVYSPLERKKEPIIQVAKSYHQVWEAEYDAIIMALKNGIGKYKNIIVFSDSRHAVSKAREKAINSTRYFKVKYDYIQIVWIPREYNFVADFFSRFFHREDEVISNLVNIDIESFCEKKSKIIGDDIKIKAIADKIRHIVGDKRYNMFQSNFFKTLSKKDLIYKDIEEDMRSTIAEYPQSEKYFAGLLFLSQNERLT